MLKAEFALSKHIYRTLQCIACAFLSTYIFPYVLSIFIIWPIIFIFVLECGGIKINKMQVIYEKGESPITFLGEGKAPTPTSPVLPAVLQPSGCKEGCCAGCQRI